MSIQRHLNAKCTHEYTLSSITETDMERGCPPNARGEALHPQDLLEKDRCPNTFGGPLGRKRWGMAKTWQGPRTCQVHSLVGGQVHRLTS